VGSQFLGFRLVAELGRGPRGRVYLARQEEPAEPPGEQRRTRLVVLKVSTDTGGADNLTRLQHPHIVPICSVHRAGPFQAVCMPWLGATTLANVLLDLVKRQGLPDSGRVWMQILEEHRGRALPLADWNPGEPASEQLAPPPPAPPAASPPAGLTWVETVLWLGARLADGLAHAHERGILHRDLRPAHVLLSEGQPMLFDFEVSEDLQNLQRPDREALDGRALGYRAPEQLAALLGLPAPVAPARQGIFPAEVDARSDLYALGVLLYELLTRRHPFAVQLGPGPQVIPTMIEERLAPPPAVRPWNPDVSPAVESIVRHCLEPDPVHRYQTAGQLREDLERQLTHQPLAHAADPSQEERLAKWVARHTTLTAWAGALVLTGFLGLALVTAWLGRTQGQARPEAVPTPRECVPEPGNP
jgi:serine/threonine protein kinase